MNAQQDNSTYAEQFKEEIRERIGTLTRLLLQLESNPGNAALISSVFREAHTIKGLGSVVGFTHVELLSHRLEDIFQAARDGRYQLDPETFDVFFRTLDLIHSSLVSPLPDSLVAQSEERISLLLSADAARAALQARVKTPVTSVPRTSSRKDVLVAPPSGLLRITTQEVDQLAGVARALGLSQLDQHAAVTDLTQLQARLLEMQTELAAFRGQLTQRSGDSQVLEEALQKCQTIASGLERYSEMITYSLEQTNRHLNLLQRTIQQIRFVPLATLFGVFPRMVRDLGQAENKDVALKIVGEGTRLDREALEMLRAPLVQMVRNAVSHGIEAADARARAGKPCPGCVTIHARQIVDRVRIDIADDGAGVDLHCLRRRAREHSLQHPEGREFTNEELMQLIFRPGFSTCDRPTEVSGRGVGLDLALNRINALGGSLSVRSVQGEGTTFSIEIPLN